MTAPASADLLAARLAALWTTRHATPEVFDAALEDLVLPCLAGGPDAGSHVPKALLRGFAGDARLGEAAAERLMDAAIAAQRGPQADASAAIRQGLGEQPNMDRRLLDRFWRGFDQCASTASALSYHARVGPETLASIVDTILPEDPDELCVKSPRTLRRLCAHPSTPAETLERVSRQAFPPRMSARRIAGLELRARRRRKQRTDPWFRSGKPVTSGGPSQASWRAHLALAASSDTTPETLERIVALGHIGRALHPEQFCFVIARNPKSPTSAIQDVVRTYRRCYPGTLPRSVVATLARRYGPSTAEAGGCPPCCGLLS